MQNYSNTGACIKSTTHTRNITSAAGITTVTMASTLAAMLTPTTNQVNWSEEPGTGEELR